MKRIKLAKFEGQNIYVGIDCHLKSWKVTLYSDEFELTTFSQDPDPGILIKYLKRNFPGANYKCVYEAGFSGFWMQREFEKQGIECIIAHPADIPTMNKEKNQKNDKIDSRKLSRSLKNNDIEGIYVPTLEMQEAKSLVRTRERIVTDIVRVKNRIKFFLMYYGIKPNTYEERSWGKKFMNELKSVQLKTQSGQQALETYIKALEFLIQQEKELKKSIDKLSKESSFAGNVRLLRTIPSIGITTAMILLSEIVDIKRFRTLDQLCSYFGLIPNTHSSGEKENVGRNTKRGNKFLKYIIIESAWSATRKDPGLLSYYKKQIVNKEPNKAIIKVARKLLNRIKTVLNEQVEYQVGLA